MKCLFIFLVSLNVFNSALAYAADCTTVKGTTVTISATFQYQELSYESKEEKNIYIYYTIGL